MEDLHPIQQRWIRNSHIPKRFHSVKMADLEPYGHDATIRGDVTDWVYAVHRGEIIGESGHGLLFIGEPGHGKTTLAAATALEVVRFFPDAWVSDTPRAVRPIYFVYYPEMLDLAKKTFDKDADEAQVLIDALFGRGPDPVQILVLDDIGKEHRTISRWAENFFDHLLRARYDAGLPTIITSNVPLKDWGAVYGKPMESFAHEALTPLAIISPKGDRRR